MLQKEINYIDYNGVERKEVLHFNLSESELTEMQLGTVGGWGEMMQKIIMAKDIPHLTAAFKDIILKSYGEISQDGRRFIKTKELAEEFSQTEAYNVLFMELITDTDTAIKFINGIIPAKYAEQIKDEKTVASLTAAN